LPVAWNRPELHDHLVVVAEAEGWRRESIRERLEVVAGRDRAEPAGTYPRYRLLLAGDFDQAAGLLSADVTGLVVNLRIPRRSGVQLIQEFRPRRPDLAILSFTAEPPRAEAMAAMLAGADHFLEYGDGSGIGHALELAIDRRWLSQLIERSAADIEEARLRLARLGGNSSVMLPGLRPPAAANAVMPFQEAARRYLLACAKLFEGDPRGLADRLGVSYYSMRRLLKRYDVPFPGRTQRSRTGQGPVGKR
jgi:DNA-binding NarL/FixJ family response regulator